MSFPGEGALLAYFRNLSMHWEMPVFASVAYVIWVMQNNRNIRRKKEKERIIAERKSKSKKKITEKKVEPKQEKTSIFKGFIFMHNFLMALFSLVVFLKTFPVIWNGFWGMSFHEFILDREKVLWRKISLWIWIFYISKYYEIVDTVILFASEKESSFLQMYHHAGAIIACWLVSLSETYSGWIWIVLNSFIHTIMYSYYAATVFGIRPPFKRLITFLQIGQFLTGFVFGFIYIFYPGSFSTIPTIRLYQIAAILFNIVYVAILTVLFVRFERKTYRNKCVSVKKTKSIRETSIPVMQTPSSSLLSSPA
ncbi:hypothetical protein NEFER03_1408 [Nematocida sp. LUAm3]|nr:hypothetical protein NEFER03_1408 [Nematocida sp. LUAm3]KAI5174762.1 hypothetical protein NEFER02_0872 [Nematocida sp. LUAm2]KAI5177827.1 hypothetical protein NEFER01_1029 [Nematocida sp. LUAm1]